MRCALGSPVCRRHAVGAQRGSSVDRSGKARRPRRRQRPVVRNAGRPSSRWMPTRAGCVLSRAGSGAMRKCGATSAGPRDWRFDLCQGNIFYFLPLPQGQGSLRPAFMSAPCLRTGSVFREADFRIIPKRCRTPHSKVGMHRKHRTPKSASVERRSESKAVPNTALQSESRREDPGHLS
jgi:hypothetical protein